MLAGGVEQQQVLEHILVHAVVSINAVLQLNAEALEELFVGFPVFGHKLLQFALNLLFQTLGDELQLMVVLEHFTGDVQGQIFAVHQAPNEVEVVRQQIRALVHNQHAAGVELKALFVILSIVVVGGGFSGMNSRAL